jgi:hypothetical protein
LLVAVVLFFACCCAVFVRGKNTASWFSPGGGGRANFSGPTDGHRVLNKDKRQKSSMTENNDRRLRF